MKKIKIEDLKVNSFIIDLNLETQKTIQGEANNNPNASAGCASIGAGGTCVLNSRCCPTFFLCLFAAEAVGVDGIGVA